MAESKWEIRAEWFLIFVLGIGFLYLCRSIVVPLLIASLLAYAFDPAVGFLERRRIPRVLGIWLIFLLIVAIIFLFLFFVIPVIQAQIVRAVERFPSYLEYFREKILPSIEETFGIHLPTTFKEISDTLLPRLREQAPAVFQPVTVFVLAFFSNTARLLVALINLIVIPFAFYYLLRDFDRLKKNVAAYIPPRHRPEAYRRLNEIDRSLGGFIRGQFLVIFFLAVFYGVGLTFIGVDLAFVLGFIAAIGEIVPYIGFTIGLSLSILIAVLQFQDFLHPFYVILLFAAIQSIQGLMVAPLVMGRQVGLHPLIVIGAIYVGGDLFGFIGVLLAVPMAAVLVVLIKMLAEHYRKSALYRGQAGS
jgi:predicted PurR-regulated permease PerM